MAEGRDLVSRAVAVIENLDHDVPLQDRRDVTSTSSTAVDDSHADVGRSPGAGPLDAPAPLHWPALADVPGAPPRGRWERKLVLALVSADVIALAFAVTLSWLARYRFTNENLAFWGYRFPYGVLALVALPLWICGLVVRGSYDRSIIGSSPTEYSRVAGVVMGLLMLICALSFVGSVPVSRGLIAVFFPTLLVFSLLGRYGVRKRLHRRRARGNALRARGAGRRPCRGVEPHHAPAPVAARRLRGGGCLRARWHARSCSTTSTSRCWASPTNWSATSPSRRSTPWR